MQMKPAPSHHPGAASPTLNPECCLALETPGPRFHVSVTVTLKTSASELTVALCEHHMILKQHRTVPNSPQNPGSAVLDGIFKLTSCSPFLQLVGRHLGGVIPCVDGSPVGETCHMLLGGGHCSDSTLSASNPDN